jgi:hypothetical protein
MRCLACGAEMILINVEDSTMTVPGFEHHTFVCSECHDTERRLVFARHAHEGDAAPTLEPTAPPVPGGESENEPPIEHATLPPSDIEPVPELAALPVSCSPNDTERVPELLAPPVSRRPKDTEPVPELTASPASREPSNTEPVPELRRLPAFLGQIGIEPMPALLRTPSAAPAQDGRVHALSFVRSAFAKMLGR